MKKILALAAVIFFITSNTSVRAQEKIHEGKIRFEMTFPDTGQSSYLFEMMPKEMIVWFKDGDTRTEMQTGRGKIAMLRYAKSKDMYTLMNMKGEKIALKMNKDLMERFKDSLKSKKAEIIVTDETKTIAFFKCRKAIATMMFRGEKKSVEVWFTKEIDNLDLGEYKVEGIDGFVMEMNIADKGLNVHMLCTSIERMNVPESLIKIPEDYKVMSMDDLARDRDKDR